ncbi:hypothetical protein Glove_323g8 [Diversispora epigaea]|uniref:Uncharacterized protein n=1 Tax=Diversispora epigaea TaxID=1348612 RepID=A0A397HN12_9GLOM|nr:hypothetical protein Glove_323g8 [Diversispora epigaea]
MRNYKDIQASQYPLQIFKAGSLKIHVCLMLYYILIWKHSKYFSFFLPSLEMPIASAGLDKPERIFPTYENLDLCYAYDLIHLKCDINYHYDTLAFK